MAHMETKYGRGENPNSLANLTTGRGGRKSAFGAQKKQRYLTITDEGWEGAKKIAIAAGCSSVSELLEKLGREQVKVLA